MPLHKNRVIVASAGSRKTTSIVEEALSLNDSRVLITTYTIENLAQIDSYIVEKNGFIPPTITIMTWFSFLLRDGVRPYQNHMTARGRIETIDFREMSPRMKYARKEQVDAYFLTAEGSIHSERVSDFVCQCDDRSNGLVIRRLEKIYDHIFIDEFQDLAGYDHRLTEKLFRSAINVKAVTDPRQATFSTNRSQKYRQFRRSGISDLVNQWESDGLISVEHLNECYRSNQIICDFADGLYPEFPKTKSMNAKLTGHDGIFYVAKHEVAEYFKERNPVILRYMKTTDTMNLPSMNIGPSKGRTYDRVLIFPTAKWKKYLKEKDLEKAGGTSRSFILRLRGPGTASHLFSSHAFPPSRGRQGKSIEKPGFPRPVQNFLVCCSPQRSITTFLSV